MSRVVVSLSNLESSLRFQAIIFLSIYWIQPAFRDLVPCWFFSADSHLYLCRPEERDFGLFYIQKKLASGDFPSRLKHMAYNTFEVEHCVLILWLPQEQPMARICCSGCSGKVGLFLSHLFTVKQSRSYGYLVP